MAVDENIMWYMYLTSGNVCYFKLSTVALEKFGAALEYFYEKILGRIFLLNKCFSLKMIAVRLHLFFWGGGGGFTIKAS